MTATITTFDEIDERGLTGKAIDGREIAEDLKAEVAGEARKPGPTA